MRTNDLESRLWLAALAGYLVFAVLGAFVSTRSPSRIDLAATALRGQATSLALFFTSLGRWYVLVPLSLVCFAIALTLRGNLPAVALIVVAQNASQGAVALLKGATHRSRPPAPLGYREVDFSYPSGHAVTSLVFYGALLLLVLRLPGCPRPVASALAAALAVCVLGIPWSRLALGAHYATDVLGGLAFGAGTLCVMAACAVRLGLVV